MPRRSNSELGSAFGQLQQQARALLSTLRKEISAKEAELERLKEDESRLGLVTGKVAAQAGPGPGPRYAQPAQRWANKLAHGPGTIAQAVQGI